MNSLTRIQLGDRIAIMVRGEIACNGSPDFLKRKFGAGFILTVVMEHTISDRAEINSALEVIERSVKGASLIDEALTNQQFGVMLPYNQWKKWVFTGGGRSNTPVSPPCSRGWRARSNNSA